MAESDVATKSPENDALKDAPASSPLIPGDSQAQTGASMGDHCTSDRPLPGGHSTTSPGGEMTKFDSIDVYISKPLDYPHSPSKLLLLLTGGTGVNSINNKLQADKYAENGYVVIMPDQFNGDPAPNTAPTEIQANPSLIERFKLGAAETAKSFMIDMWLARHTPEKVMPILHKVLESAKDEYADAVANGGGIYAVGYCFGAKYVIMLAGEHPDGGMIGQAGKDEEAGVVSKGPAIKAGAIAHATLVTREDMVAIKAPISMVCVGKHIFLTESEAIADEPVENDPLFPDDILSEGRKHLESSKVDHEIKTYDGVPHGKLQLKYPIFTLRQLSNPSGFAVVGDYSAPTIKEAQLAAFDQMLAWIQKY